MLEELKRDFPDLRFATGVRFAFKPPRTVKFMPVQNFDAAEQIFWQHRILHEVGHFVAGHRDFKTEVERLKMEVEAWEKAKELAPRYGVEFDQEIAENELDSYRDWLHQRSRCPECGLTRYQTPDGEYHCPGCENCIIAERK